MNLKRVFALRDHFLELLLPLAGQTLEGPSLSALVGALALTRPAGKRRLVRYALLGSLEPYLGQALDKRQLWELAFRLAGNVPRLEEGLTVGPWQGQAAPEWVTLQVKGVQALSRLRRKGSQEGVRLTLRCLTGSPTPLLITALWPRAFVWGVAPSLGFHRDRQSDRDGYCGFVAAGQLYNLFFQGLLEPELCQQEGPGAAQPGFWSVRCPAALRARNRGLLRRRLRLDQFRCPLDYDHACHECPKGTDACPVATHARSYVSVVCRDCHQTAWADPATRLVNPLAGPLGTLLCLDCADRQQESRLR